MTAHPFREPKFRITKNDVAAIEWMMKRLDQADFDDYRQGLVEFHDYRRMLIERINQK